MDELDARLRSLASESLDRTAADVPVEDDLATFRARLAERPVPAPERDSSWTRLGVAATLVLLVAGAVTVLATRDGGDELVAPPATDVSASTTQPSALTTTEPTTVATTTPVLTTQAMVEPAVVPPGAVVTITPVVTVSPLCPGSAKVFIAGRAELFGWIAPGEPSFLPAPLVGRELDACDMIHSADPREVLIPVDLAPGTYRICIDEDASASGCGVVVVDGGSTSATVVPATTTTSSLPTPETLPVGYVERRYVEEPPYFELRDVAPDGSVLGQAGAETIDELLRREIETGVGGSVRLLPEEQPYGRCDAREVVAADATATAQDLIGPVRSLAATVDGVVVAGVDVCPDGARWGDQGTRFELRRIDLTSAATTVLHVREPGDGDTFFADQDVVYAGGELVVESVSPEGAYVAVAEPYTTEDTRYHVFSTEVSGQTAPIELGSACDDPRDLVGPPRFVGDGRVVVARECSPVDGEIGNLTVELVSLDTREPLWSVGVEGVAIDSYSHTVSLDAAEVEGRVWALVSGSAGVERPIRATAVTDGAELALPGGAIVAFDPRTLIEPWDPSVP